MARGIGHSVLRDVERLYAEGTAAGASDEQLLARFTDARDQSSLAFEVIVRRHGPMVLETCRRLLGGDHHAAEDAFQATFLVLARRADAIDTGPSGSLGPWLHEVACRTAYKARVARLRRESREHQASADKETSIAASRNGVDELDDYRVLHEEVSRLPEKHRAAIVLCYFEGMTHDQAAASLRWPVGTVRGYLARARDLLRTRLVRRGVTPAVAVALLESRSMAALPPPLIETVLRGIAHVSAGSTAAALGVAISRGLAISRAKRSLIAVILLALGAGGAGLVASQFRASSAIEPTAQTGPIVAAHLAERHGRGERLDAHGDPLPDGAVARLGTSRFNHGNNITDVAYTPDGKGLVSFGGDGFVRVWDPSNGRLVRSIISDGSQGSREFSLSADRKRMVTVERSHEANFRLWDFETGRELRRVPVPNPKPYLSLMTYSPDRKTVATVLYNNSIVFRDGESLAEVGRMKVESGNIHQIAFSPDGRLLAGTSAAHQAHLGGEPIAGLGGGASRPRPIQPNLDPLETASLVIWDVAKAVETKRIDMQGCHPNRVVFSPDGRSLVAPFCDGTIRFLDVARGRERFRLRLDGPGQRTIAFSPDGSTLASGDDAAGTSTSAIHLWDLARKRETRRLAVPHDPYGLAFSPDGTTLASAQWEKNLRLWDLATGREIDPKPSHRNSVACLVVSPGGETVITGGYDNAIRQWDAATGRELSVIGTHADPVYDLAISPDGRYLISSSIEGREVRLTELAAAQGAPRHLPINPGSRGRGLAFSPDGLLAFASGKISDVTAGQEAAALLDEEGKPFHPWAWACFTPDNTGLLATDGGTIWLWNVSGGKPVRKIASPGIQIMSIAVSPDGRFLAVGAGDAVQLWHLATGREVKTAMRHDANFVVAAFSPDGRLIVSGCGYDTQHDDPSVRVWELATGQEVRRFNGHRAGVYSVSFFPDSRRVASAGSDAIAMVWDLALDANGQAAPATPPELESLWGELDKDAARAYRAIWRLSAAGDQIVPFFAERLHPIRPDDPDRDTALGPIATGETLRRLRAIAVLEKINNPASRRLLERVATGLEGARETRDARAALRRTSRRATATDTGARP